MVSRKPPSHENVFAFNVIYLYKTRLPEHDMAPLSAEDEFSDEEARIFTLAAFLELADAHIPINGTEIIVQCGVLSYAHSIYAVSKEPDSP
jgi:hypothetical protein